MELMAKIAFAVYVLLILCGGVMAVKSQSLIRALVGLIVTLLGVAGLYMLLASPFMAFMQILIYVGAVAVLIFFAIGLSKADEDGIESEPAPMRKYLYGLLAFITPAVILSWLVVKNPVESVLLPTEVAIGELGEGLLGGYFLAFELISVVLLVAMSGAVLLAWEKRREDR